MFLKRRIGWRKQPQSISGTDPRWRIDSALTAVNGNGAEFRTLAGSAWTLVGGASLAHTKNALGHAITQTGTNYFSRSRPWSLSGGRTWAATLVCGSSSAQGVWSVASSEITSSPHLLIQRNGTDLRIYGPGTGYVATFTGVATAGAVLRIAWGYSQLAASTAGTAYLAVNGQIKSGAYAGGANAATNEYLFSGYATQYLGDIGDFYSLPGCIPELVARLSENPYLTYLPAADTIPLPTAAGGGDVTVALTGVGATGALGTLSPQIDSTAALTGNAATGAVGTVVASSGVVVAATGVAATGAVGTLSPQVSSTAALTGAAAIAACGTVIPDFTKAITGSTATGSVGTVVATSGVVVALTGAEVSGAVGTLSPQSSATVALTGNAATGACGTVTASFTGTLTDSEKLDLILDILSNRQELTTGLYTLYADDGTTVLYTAAAWEDAAATVPYRGQGLARLDAMQ